MYTTITPNSNENTTPIIPIAPIEQIALSYQEFMNIKNKLLNESDYQTIGNKQFMKKGAYRKLALAFGISTEIIHQERKDLEERFVYTITVKATSPSGRYMTASGACSSTERKFAHIDHDCYAIAGTRAVNRAISDLLGIAECSYEEMITTPLESDIVGDTPYTPTVTTDDPITPKQKSLLTRLIESRYNDTKIKQTLYAKLESLTKGQAKLAIAKMLA